MNPLTFASVPYANAVVPTRYIGRACPGTRLRTDVPSRLHDLLLSGGADAALVPVVDYLFGDDLSLAGDFGIAADGPVESVLLACRVPRDRVRTVAMDPASHTSNVLAELLFQTHWKQNVRFGDTPDADATVIIGDRALRLTPSRTHVDLADAWREATGLPFVFAVWACRQGHPRQPEMADILRLALAAGMSDAPALAAEQARLLGIAPEHVLRYMTRSIRYHIGERERRAMETFRGMVTRHGETLATLGCTALAQT